MLFCKEFFLHSFNDMKWLIAKFTSTHVKFCKVIVRVNLLPIGKDLSVSSTSVKLVRIKLYLVEASGYPDESETTWLDETPGSCHGDQISPRVQHVTVSEKKEIGLLLLFRCNSPSPNIQAGNVAII